MATATDGRRYASSAFTPKRAICYIVTEPMTRAAEAYVPVPYSDLQEAVDAVEDEGGTVYLTADVTIDDTIKVGGQSVGNSKSCTIKSDPNSGEKYTLTRGQSLTDSMFEVLIASRAAGSDLSASLTLEEVVMDGNHISSEYAMIYVQRCGTVTLGTGTVLKNGINSGDGNTTTQRDKNGGAVYIGNVDHNAYDPGKLVIEEEVVIENCKANFGGAIYVDCRESYLYAGYDGILEIRGGIIRNNSAGDGGGIYAGKNTQINVENCVFEGNTAASSGGAVFMTAERNEEKTAKFTNCTFENNKGNQKEEDQTRTDTGGGAVAIINESDRNCKVIFDNCKFQGNNTKAAGGAILVCGKDGDNAEQLNSEKADGTEGEGSGIWQAAEAKLTITGTNTIPEGQEIWLNAANPDSVDGAMLTVTGDLNLTDRNQLSVDFPNYVADRKIAEYTDGTNPPDEAEAAKYKVDTTKLAAGLNVGAEDQYVLLTAPPSYDLTFYKVDAEEKTNAGSFDWYYKGLEGVKFMLYTCASEDSGHQHDTLAGETSQTKGCWTPVIDEETNQSKIWISGEDGETSITGLSDGEYMLVETETLPGYKLPKGQWYLEIVDGELSSQTHFPEPKEGAPSFVYGSKPGDNAIGIVYTLLPNEKEIQVVLPNTGGAGAAIGILAGASALTGTGASLLLRKKHGKRRKKR